MGYIGSGAYGAIVYRGYGMQRGIGHMDIGAHGHWGHGYRVQGVWATWTMGHRQWGTGIWGTGAMGYRDIGHMGNGACHIWIWDRS